KFQKTLAQINDDFEKYRISDALMAIYKLTWDDFCSWYLEMIKPGYQQPIDRVTFDKTIAILEDLLKLLHPFMPFLTEEIWQHITERNPEQALVIASYANETALDENVISGYDLTTEVIEGVRTIRIDKNIPFEDAIELKVINNVK